MGTRIDEAALPVVLDNFYARVRSDALLGPVCSATPDDWPAELKPLAGLWSGLMLTSGLHGNIPLRDHELGSPRLTRPMFERWLSLWRRTAGELLPLDSATAMQVKAARLSIGLQRVLGLRVSEA